MCCDTATPTSFCKHFEPNLITVRFLMLNLCAKKQMRGKNEPYGSIKDDLCHDKKQVYFFNIKHILLYRYETSFCHFEIPSSN